MTEIVLVWLFWIGMAIFVIGSLLWTVVHVL